MCGIHMSSSLLVLLFLFPLVSLSHHGRSSVSTVLARGGSSSSSCPSRDLLLCVLCCPSTERRLLNLHLTVVL